jgi:hypothetical protein
MAREPHPKWVKKERIVDKYEGSDVDYYQTEPRSET